MRKNVKTCVTCTKDKVFSYFDTNHSIFEGLIISISQVIYEIDTQQGLAKLYHRTPDSTGFPVLFIHGFGSNSDIWFAFDDSLGNYFINNKMDCWALNLSNAISGNIQTLAHEDLLAAVDFIYKERNQRVLIVSHSMGGIITRVFTSSHLSHPYPLQQIERMVQGVALLTVPNHGVGSADISRIEETVKLLHSFIKSDQEPLAADFGLGFIQLTPKSHLITSLNEPLPLNSNIIWLNAVGSYDKVVPLNSALFKESEVDQIPHFFQQEFPCDHMVYPFSKTIKKIVRVIPQIIESSKLESRIRIYPAIHRYQPVGDWILKHLVKPLG
ncbi:MAG: esterase/lipase family protein [Promethearchaeota archaeon]